MFPEGRKALLREDGARALGRHATTVRRRHGIARRTGASLATRCVIDWLRNDRTDAQGTTVTRARKDRLLGLLVRDGEWVTAATLADGIGVTPRSIRSYVTSINARVADGVAVESGPQGYRAGPEASAALRITAGTDAGTPRDRLHTLVRALLETDEGVDVFEAAEAMQDRKSVV